MVSRAGKGGRRSIGARTSVAEALLMGFIYLVVAGFVFVTLYPFLHIISVSLSSPAEAVKPGMHFFPRDLSFSSYEKILQMPLLFTAYQNTIFVVLFGTFCNLIFTILTAYPLSRRYLIWRSQLTMYVVFTMLFSGGLIPTYLLMRSLNLVNNRLVLILAGLISPYNMIIMKNFFQSIPNALEESAKIDGANDFRILMTIILPLSAPVLATIGLFYAVTHWNAFFTCMIYISDRSKMVLQVLLRQMIITSEMTIDSQSEMMLSDIANQSLAIQDKYTVIVVATLPILIVYPFLQKYFVKGTLIGAVKG